MSLRSASAQTDEARQDYSQARVAHSGRERQREVVQLSLLAAPSPLVEEIEAIDVDSLTPLDAIRRLYELRERARALSR